MKRPAITYIQRHQLNPPRVTMFNDTRIWTEIRGECSYTLDEVYDMVILELDRFNKSEQRKGLPLRELVGVRWADEDEK